MKISQQIRLAIAQQVALGIAHAFRESSRWGVVHVLPGVALHGVVIGELLREHVGAVAVLALQADGTIRLQLASVAAVVHATETDVRQALVRATRQRFISHDHDFRASPVSENLCALCAGTELDHVQARQKKLVAQALNISDVQVSFEPGTQRVIGVLLRQPQVDSAKVQPYRALSSEELDRLNNVLTEVV